MPAIYPWGHVDWLLPKLGERQWTGLFCTSFEQRCTAAPSHLASRVQGRVHCLKIQDPESEYTELITRATLSNLTDLRSSYGKRLDLIELGLLDDAATLNRIAESLVGNGECSVLLDITSLPKRMFLFFVKRLLQSHKVRDLVVCYTRANGYREGNLTDDAEPPAALPGYARVAMNSGNSTVIVSVGYMAFNLGELLEQHRARSPKFLFPFPPGSPSFRRNWRLLHGLLSAPEANVEVKRMSAFDMFGALNWIKSLEGTTEPNIDLIPLGPKPHALAMGLGHTALGDSAEVLYSQPRLYHPDYSVGVAFNRDSLPEIHAYCLRKDYVNFT